MLEERKSAIRLYTFVPEVKQLTFSAFGSVCDFRSTTICLLRGHHPHVSCVFFLAPPGTFTTTSNLIVSKDEIIGSASSLPEGQVRKSVAKITEKHWRVDPIGQPIHICFDGNNPLYNSSHIGK